MPLMMHPATLNSVLHFNGCTFVQGERNLYQDVKLGILLYQCITLTPYMNVAMSLLCLVLILLCQYIKWQLFGVEMLEGSCEEACCSLTATVDLVLY